MPLAATVPNSTMPAPPSTGVGTAAMIRPRTGSRPRTTRIAPPALTTNRLFTPVMATRPTFCANALWVKELNTGDRALESMSARSPLAMRLEETLLPVISPTARMSAVVSVSVTRMTMSMEMIAAISKVGGPNANGVGRAKMSPSPTSEKSALPITKAKTVPTTMASRIDSREMVPLPTLLSSSTTSRVSAASPILPIDPWSGAAASPPIAQFAATGISDRPMTVITTPLTTGGKKRITLAKTGVISRPTTEAAMTAPNTDWMPPSPSRMAVIVATPAKETPCTSGSFDPKNGRPRVCSRVAAPPTNRQAATSMPISAPDIPAAVPMISGGAMIPPYIVSTCCSP